MNVTSGAPTAPLHCARVAHRSVRTIEPTVRPYGSGSACMPCEVPRTALRLQRERARTRGRPYPPNMTNPTSNPTANPTASTSPSAVPIPESIPSTGIPDPDGVIADAAIDPADAAISHPLIGDAKVEEQAPTFVELGVDPRIVRALNESGIERTFAIQALTLPIALGGADLIGQARTGMGKTLGFGVPLLQRLALDDSLTLTANGKLPAGRAPRALVMVPTRELCVQVTRDLHQAAKYMGLAVTSVYGGRAYEPQITALHNGVDLVVGTPGRLLDLANGGHLVLGAVKVLVLDEADEMLDLGFLPDMERVLGMVPDVKQTMLFSATMPGPILTLARTFMAQPTHIRAELAAEGQTHTLTKQYAYRAHALDKVEMLARVLQARNRGLTMVFTRTKRTAAKVADDLIERGFAAAAVHGGGGEAPFDQIVGHLRGGALGAGEHHRQTPIPGLQDPGQHLHFVQRVRPVGVLLGQGVRLALGSQFGADVRRLGHEGARQGENRARHGRREQHGLLDVGHHAEHPLHVRQETEVEHLVRLVQHQHLDGAQHQMAAVGQIQQPTRGADNQINPVVQGGDLRFVGATAVHRGHREPHVLGGLMQVTGDLYAQLAGRHHDQRAGGAPGGQLSVGSQRQAVVQGEPLQQRDAEAESLPHAGASLTDQVGAAQRDRQGQCLDGEGPLDAGFVQRTDDARVDAEFDEGGGLFLDLGVTDQRVGDGCVGRVDGGVGDHTVGVRNARTWDRFWDRYCAR